MVKLHPILGRSGLRTVLTNNCYRAEGIEAKHIRQYQTQIKTHFHPEYEICYVLEGDRHFFVRDRNYYLVKGDLLLIPANELHRGDVATNHDYEKLEIKFLPSFLLPLQHGLSQGERLLAPFHQQILLFHLSDARQQYVSSLMFQMIEEMRHEADEYIGVVRMLLSQLLIALLRELQPFEPVKTLPSAVAEKGEQLIQYINSHYEEKLTLVELAEKHHYHPCYLSVLFKQLTNFTFSEYLNNVRVRQSQQLLTETELDITDICSRTGFSSLSHYGRVFKRLAGISPREYRKRAKQGRINRKQAGTGEQRTSEAQ